VARERAADAMLELDWVEGDPARLPFEDASFDRVLSAFGHLFAPHPQRAAAELLRVCRPGGAIGICSWTPDGVGGRLYRLAASRLGGATPTLWGSEEQLRELFGAHVRELELERRAVTFADRSPEAWLDFLAESFVPFGPEPGPELRAELLGVLREANQAGDGGLRFEQEYLLAVARI
jgi:ubiquinone/menaquinone biosynthesis C-methylase UbiE